MPCKKICASVRSELKSSSGTGSKRETRDFFPTLPPTYVISRFQAKITAQITLPKVQYIYVSTLYIHRQLYELTRLANLACPACPHTDHQPCELSPSLAAVTTTCELSRRLKAHSRR